MSLNNHHLAMLAASGITPEHAAERGYETDHRQAPARRDGASRTAARGLVPGLLVPLLRADGSTWGYQYRPDESAVCATAGRSSTRHRGSSATASTYRPASGRCSATRRSRCGSPRVSKKADCGALHGLCVVALSGVWNWLGTNTARRQDGARRLAGHRLGLDDNRRRRHRVRRRHRPQGVGAEGRAHALAAYLARKGAEIEYPAAARHPTTRPGWTTT